MKTRPTLEKAILQPLVYVGNEMREELCPAFDLTYSDEKRIWSVNFQASG